MSSEMTCNLKKHTDKLSLSLVRIYLYKYDVDYSVPLGNDIYAYAKSPFRCTQIHQSNEQDDVMQPVRQVFFSKGNNGQHFWIFLKP